MYYCTTDMNLISFSIVLEVRLLILQWPDFTGVTKEGILQTCMNSFHFPLCVRSFLIFMMRALKLSN